MWKQVGFWSLVFIVFLQLLLWTRILVFWASKTYHLEACCLHFTTLGTILSAWGHPGGPWEQQEGHVGVRSKIFSDFCLILGPHFESFLSSDGLNSVFFWSLFPGHFLHRFVGEIMEVGALGTRFSCGRYCKNHVFAKIIFWCFEGRILVFFRSPGSRFSDFFCLGNKLENWVFFKVTLGTLIGTRK